MLPTTFTIAGLNTQPGFALYPASLVLTKVTSGADNARYLSDPIPVTVNGASRTVLGRVAEITFSQKKVAKDKGVGTLIRVRLPQQGNEAATTVDEIDDGFITLAPPLTRSLTAVPSGIAAACKAVTSGVFTNAMWDSVSVGAL